MRDYWRTFFTPLSPADAAAGARLVGHARRRCWKAVEKLVGLSEVLGEGLPPAHGAGARASSKRHALADIKAPWAAWVDELQA